MGLVDKFKDLFTDEVEVDEAPVKKEVMHVEISPPKEEEKEVKKEEVPVLENEVLKDIPKEEKVWFDDEDFETLPKAEKKELPKKPVSTYKINKEKKDTKKHFSPSPIISPVYGVLDKNYLKEDVREKNKKDPIYNTKTDLSIDAIRKKAFGTIEDELETDLYSAPLEDDSSNDQYYEEEGNGDIFDELDFNLNGVLDEDEEKSEIDYVAHVNTRSDRNKPLFDELKDEENNEEEAEKDDLFDLIDTMYDEKEEL